VCAYLHVHDVDFDVWFVPCRVCLHRGRRGHELRREALAFATHPHLPNRIVCIWFPPWASCFAGRQDGEVVSHRWVTALRLRCSSRFCEVLTVRCSVVMC
jgi:hypothetical protein